MLTLVGRSLVNIVPGPVPLLEIGSASTIQAPIMSTNGKYIVVSDDDVVARMWRVG